MLHMSTQWIFGVWVGVHGLEGSVPIRYPVTLKKPFTHSALVSSALFPSTLPLHVSFPLLPLSSLESKVEPSSVELENSESLFLKTSDSDPAPRLPASHFFFSSSFFLSVYTLSLCLPLSAPISPLLLPSLPSSLLCQCRKVEGEGGEPKSPV